MKLWHNIVEYYKTIGLNYHVNPVVFVGIHVAATPLFAACIGWIVYNKKKKKSILLPSLMAVFIFNAASIYLIIKGRSIPIFVYCIVALSALVSGYFSYKRIKKRIANVD